MKTAVQTAITAIPAKGPKHTGLRSAMRKATKLRVRTTGSQVGVRLEVAPGAMPAGKENLPAYMEGRARWRHPYFGTGTWVGQASHPYFDRTVMPYVVKARRGAELAVKETADSI